MASRRKPCPSYLAHKQSGRAVASWTDPTGTRRTKLLPGPFKSPESLAAFGRLQIELATAPTSNVERSDITIVELFASYMDFARDYYADADGKPTNEVSEMKSAINPALDLYDEIPATEFGPLKLEVVRQRMIESGWCRALINRRVNRIRRVFKWAVSKQLVPVATFQALSTLAGLRRGRTEAREKEPVKPVDPGVVASTLPYLPTHVRAIVELLRLTGMRPAEACAMTLGQIDRSGDVWVYRPVTHKTKNAGKDRSVPLGPRSRALLIDFLRGRVLTPTAQIFSPRVAREERFAEMRARRATRVQPSQLDRSRANPKRQPAEQYSVRTIAHAVEKAAKKAGADHWHPYQLRHLFASEVRRDHGLEAAQVLLGHSRADVTQIYAERDAGLAVEVAAKIG